MSSWLRGCFGVVAFQQGMYIHPRLHLSCACSSKCMANNSQISTRCSAREVVGSHHCNRLEARRKFCECLSESFSHCPNRLSHSRTLATDGQLDTRRFD